MKIKERIEKALSNLGNFGNEDSIDKLIAVAYYMGREQASKEICDKVSDIFAEQKDRAEKSRYHNMAMNIQGNIDAIYSSDYAQDMTKAFGGDETKL